MPKISVIVPIYNSEKHIAKCLDSIVNQKYKDIEIIIVNDGSTDNSEEIIQKYINKCKGIVKYYKKQNSGLSSARNFGMKKASGEYISFIDSDDYIDINLFAELEKHINKNIDLIKYKLIKLDQTYNEIERVNGPIFDNLNGEEAFNVLCLNDLLFEPSCLYLYKSSFLSKNNFQFAEGLYHEDFGLTPLVILKAKSVSSINFYGYYYLQSFNSITRDNDYKQILKRATDLLLHYDNMIDKISKYNISVKTKNIIKTYFTNSILLVVKDLNKSDQKQYIGEIKKRKMVNNIKVTNIKQLLKKIILKISIKLYLNIR